MEGFFAEIFRAMGADQDVAAEVARHLVRSSLSGHDSHGVIRVAHCGGQASCGELNPSAKPTVVREAAVPALVNAHGGFGHFATAWFGDGEHHRTMVSETLGAAKGVEPATGSREILVPGAPEVRARARRSGEGVSQELPRIGREYGARPPEALPAPRVWAARAWR
jgi:LDH2 family malate/lactate/ureidoglycolate dehydrogenase